MIEVFAFNVWGMPSGLGGCQYKKERMEALADMIESRKPYFDLLLLNELWMQADHQILEDAAKNVGLYMTEFRQLASKSCDGQWTMIECSGLAIISAYPLKEVEFHQYTWKGQLWDLEPLAGKGVGRVTIEPIPGMKVDVFVTHTIADGSSMYNQTWYRIKQAEELVESYLKTTTADAVILGGDFNAPPILEPGTPYYIIQKFMHNVCEESFCHVKEFATYGNQRNYFSYVEEPVTLDYIFHKGMSPGTKTWADWSEFLILRTNIINQAQEVSIPLSDHEPVISTRVFKGRDVLLSLCPGTKKFPCPVVSLSRDKKVLAVPLSLCPGTKTGAKIPRQTLLSLDVPGQNKGKKSKKIS
jgi:endonuclease/exonuclease/phosphatase family metal-dependent hydrolase